MNAPAHMLQRRQRHYHVWPTREKSCAVSDSRFFHDWPLRAKSSDVSALFRSSSRWSRCMVSGRDCLPAMASAMACWLTGSNTARQRVAPKVRIVATNFIARCLCCETVVERAEASEATSPANAPVHVRIRQGFGSPACPKTLPRHSYRLGSGLFA